VTHVLSTPPSSDVNRLWSTTSLEAVCPALVKNQPKNQVLRFCEEQKIRCTPVQHPKKMTLANETTGEKFYLPHLDPDPAKRTEPFDIAVVVSFRYFLPPSVLRVPPVINMHPSLLPKYRGASPIISTVMRGEKVGGASIIKVVEGERMDCGDVLIQESLPIPVEEDARQYFPRVVSLGAKLLCHVLFEDGTQHSTVSVRRFRQFWDQARVQPHKFDLSKELDPFHAPLLSKADAGLQWSTGDATGVTNRWRALIGSPFHPFAVFNPKKSPIGPTIKNAAKLQPRRVHFDGVIHPDSVAMNAALSSELNALSVGSMPSGSFYRPESDPSVGAILCSKPATSGTPSPASEWPLIGQWGEEAFETAKRISTSPSASTGVSPSSPPTSWFCFKAIQLPGGEFIDATTFCKSVSIPPGRVVEGLFSDGVAPSSKESKE
jgi:folate-dependent phosphoribosylglycinamide formyltransferase PurN